MSIATENVDLYRDLDGQQSSWLTRVNKYTDLARRGKLYTEEQKTAIQAYDIEAVGINLCKKVVNTVAANIFSNKNSKTVIPLGDAESNIAFLWQAIFNAYEQEIKWRSQLDQILKDEYSVGIGIARVDVADNIFGTVTKYTPYHSLRWAQSSDDFFWDDLQFIVYFKKMLAKEAIIKGRIPFDDRQTAVSKMTDLTDIYKNTFGEGTGKSEMAEVYWIESYYKDSKEYQQLLFKNSDGSTYNTMNIPVEDNKDTRGYSGDSAFDNAYSYFYKLGGNNQTIANESIRDLKELRPLTMTRIIKKVSVGNYDVGEFVLPCSRMPFIPFINELCEYPEGILTDIEQIQAALNQTMLLLIHNGRMLSTPRVLAPEGSIDPMKFAMQMSNPLGVITYKSTGLSMSGQQNQPPVIWAPQNVGSHFTELIIMLKNLAEDIAGVYATFQGNPQKAPETYKTLASLNNQASQLLMPTLINGQHSIAVLGGVEKDFIAWGSKDNMILRYKEHNDELLEKFTAETEGEISQDTLGVRTNMPGYNAEIPINYKKRTGNATVIRNNLKDTKVGLAVVINTIPDTDNYRNMIATELSLIAQQSPELNTIIAPAILQLSGYPLTKELAAKMDKVKALTMQVQQQNEAINQLQANLLQAESRATTSRVSEHVAEISKGVQEKLNGILLQVENAKNKLELFTKQAMTEGGNTTGVQAQATTLASEIQTIIDNIGKGIQEEAQRSNETVQAMANAETNQQGEL